MYKSTRLIKLLLIMLIAVSACGYDGHYRYSCQDPENWDKEECKLPLCKVDGNCTEALLGFNPTETTIEVVPVEETVAP
jgi:hypothetical protein